MRAAKFISTEISQERSSLNLLGRRFFYCTLEAPLILGR
uniref:Uncharacterized protein n=1 Tax=Arundo donax TaxID=35708 RepID=A0A0A9CNA9_ARUDO